MDNIELLECLICTEIEKVKFQIKIAHIKGQKIRKKALYSELAGLKKSLNFIDEINQMEE